MTWEISSYYIDLSTGTYDDLFSKVNKMIDSLFEEKALESSCEEYAPTTMDYKSLNRMTPHYTYDELFWG